MLAPHDRRCGLPLETCERAVLFSQQNSDLAKISLGRLMIGRLMIGRIREVEVPTSILLHSPMKTARREPACFDKGEGASLRLPRRHGGAWPVGRGNSARAD